MEMLYPIDAERMNKVLRRRRLNLRWDELWEMYVNYQPSCSELFGRMDVRDVVKFGCCFRFSTSNLTQMRKELAKFVKDFPEFCGDSLDEVVLKMYYRLQEYNGEHGTRFPCVNWIPDYGGMLQQPDPNEQIRWMQERGIPCPLTGILPRTQGEKR